MFKKNYQIIVTHETENHKKIILQKYLKLNWLMAIYVKFWICRHYTNNKCNVKIMANYNL